MRDHETPEEGELGKYYSLPNASKEKMPQLFQKGRSGNPLGGTRESALGGIRNAEKAVRIREKFLDTLQSRIATIEVIADRESEGDPELAESLKTTRIMALLSADVNRLMTDSENRGFGAPKQIVEQLPTATRSLDEYSDDELLLIASGEYPDGDPIDSIPDAEVVDDPDCPI